MADARSDHPDTLSPPTRRGLLRLTFGGTLAAALGAAAAGPVAAAVQNGWFFCPKCQGLFFAANGSGECPAGAGHTKPGGKGYLLFADYTPPSNYSAFQFGWRYCRKCLGLHYVGDGNPAGPCPVGGKQAASSSGDYMLYVGRTAVPDYQGGWHFCSKCRGLWFAGNRGKGECPAGRGHKKAAGSKGYSLYETQ